MITINNINVEAFVDFGNGFKFLVESCELNDFGNLILKVNSNSIKWIEIEHSLDNPLSLRGYDQFLAECYEADDEFWENYFEDLETDDIIMSHK